MAAIIAGALNIGSSLLSNKSKPNPHDYEGWTYGDAKWWVTHDGINQAEIANEAANIESYIKKNGIQGMLVDGYDVPAVTEQQIKNKLIKGGYSSSKAANVIPATNVSAGSKENNPNIVTKNKWVMPLLISVGAIVLIGATVLVMKNRK